MKADDERAEREVAKVLLERWLPAQRARLGIAGISAGVVLPGGEVITMADGLADRDAGRPMTADTPMRLASITKMFTVTAMLMARDRGLLSLDAPASELVPELSSMISPAAAPAPITLRQVVSHTAGLPTNLPHGVQYWTPESGDDVVTFPSAQEARGWLRDLRLLHPPMTEFHYSNVGFMIAGLALEQAFGQPYEDLMREHILGPLGMDRAFFGSAEELRRLPQGYRPDGSGDAHAPPLEVGWDTAGGGLCCSVSELARFARLHLSDRPAGGGQVLGGSSIREAREPVFLTPDGDKGVGLGWWLRRVDGRSVVMHSGNMAGFDACMVLAPELELAAFLLGNSNRIQSSLVLVDLIRALMAVVGTGRTIETRFRREAPPAEAAQVTGRYSTYEWDYDVVAIGGRIAIVILADFDHVAWLEPTGAPGEYVGAEGFASGEPVVFRELQDGRFTELALQGLVLRRP